MRGHLDWIEATTKITGQFIGGILGALWLLLVVADDVDQTGDFAALHLEPTASYLGAFIAEVVTVITNLKIEPFKYVHIFLSLCWFALSFSKPRQIERKEEL